jgi:hypothetical protein
VFGQQTVQGTCSTCHNVPNVGGHAVFRMFDIGAADEEFCADDIPVLTIQHKVTGESLSGDQRDDLVAFLSAL